MGIRFNGWPFEKDERVVLHWLRSPSQVGPKKQWKMQTVFRREDDSLEEVTIPWGALPMLRLGSVFRDGKPTGEVAVGTPARIRFDAGARTKICSGWSVPVPYGLKEADVNEWCVIVWLKGRQFVIPCLEVIRAYFALNRMMTAALLRPDSFNDICTASLANREAHLDFSSHVAAASLSPEALRRMALILFEPTFENSWKKVWGSIAQPGSGGSAQALRTEPPALAGSAWDVVSVGFGQTVLVLQIRQFTPAVKLPFTSVSYAHPSFRKYVGERTSGGDEGEARTVEVVEGVEIPPGPASPGNLPRPQTVQIGFTTANLPEAVELVKIQETIQRDQDGDESKGGGGEVIQERIPVKEGTLNDEGGFGELPSVEFRHFESMDDVSPGFHKLFKALNHIDRACISFLEGSAPEGCGLPKLPKGSEMPRPYVLVCVSVLGKRFFLVEVDVSDGHSMSTLVFTVEEGQEITAKTEKVLREAIAVGGHWDRKELGSLLGGRRFELVKHTRSLLENWGQRIRRAGVGCSCK